MIQPGLAQGRKREQVLPKQMSGAAGSEIPEEIGVGEWARERDERGDTEANPRHDNGFRIGLAAEKERKPPLEDLTGEHWKT
jgi:hypothetical protein